MSNYFIFLLLVACTSVSSAQIIFVQHTIDGNYLGAGSVHAVDVNGDSLVDVICSGLTANSIAWWKNDGNHTINWEKQTVVNNFLTASSVFAIDINDNGNADIVGSAWMSDEIAWWKNDGGNPIQWTKQTISLNFDGVEAVFATDIDSDEDLDILGAAMNGNQIALWYNNGENPITWTKKVIDTNFGWARSVYAVDMNGDTLVDILGAAYSANTISIWYNNGDSTWTEQVVDNSFGGAHRVFASYLDDDNRIDVIGAAYLDDEIAWWKNEGGNPIQWSKHTIDGNFDGAISVYTCDIDEDGDTDVIGAAEFSGYVALWLNDGGSAISWTKQMISSNFAGAWGVYAEDIDNDGDIDVLSGASIANEIAWWENDGLVGVEKYSKPPDRLLLYQNFPNPFNPNTIIKYTVPSEGFVSLKVFDVLGNEIAILVSAQHQQGEYEVEFNTTEITSGIYLYQLRANDNTETMKMVLLK
jgi:hypothetical protein